MSEEARAGLVVLVIGALGLLGTAGLNQYATTHHLDGQGQPVVTTSVPASPAAARTTGCGPQ